MSSRTEVGKVFTIEQEPPVDRRIQRTRALLHDAFFQLVTEYGYESITIQNITERANLGRTTFYLHYQDKEELLKSSVKTLMDELERGVEPTTDEVCSYEVRCIRIFTHIVQHQKVYHALLKESGSVDIGTLMRHYFVKLLNRYLLEQPSHNEAQLSRELLAAHAAGALFGLISWWLEHDVSPDAETMGTAYYHLMAKGAETMLGLGSDKNEAIKNKTIS